MYSLEFAAKWHLKQNFSSCSLDQCNVICNLLNLPSQQLHYGNNVMQSDLCRSILTDLLYCNVSTFFGQVQTLHVAVAWILNRIICFHSHMQGPFFIQFWHFSFRHSGVLCIDVLFDLVTALYCSPWSSNQALTDGLCVPLRDHTMFTCWVCTLILSSVSVSVQEEVYVLFDHVHVSAYCCLFLPITQSLLTSKLISTWPLVFIYRPHGVLCPDWLWHCRSTANWINTITYILTMLRVFHPENTQIQIHSQTLLHNYTYALKCFCNLWSHLGWLDACFAEGCSFIF